MSDHREDVPAPKRAKAKTGTRSTQPADLPGWLTDLGDPGGMRFRLLRLEPGVYHWPPSPKAIRYDEIESKGPGIYEVQTERRDARGAWRTYGRPRQVTIQSEGAGISAASAPASADPRDAMIATLLERALGAHAPPANPYSLPGGPAVPADTLDEIKATHREQLAEQKRGHAESMETQRMLWEDRLSTQRTNAEALKGINESRVRELEARVRRLEDELAEARSSRTDPLSEAIKRIEETERLKEHFGGNEDGHWVQSLLKNPEGVGQILERLQGPGAAQARPAPAPHQAPHQAPGPTAPPAPSPAPEAQKSALVEALESLLAHGASVEHAYSALAPHVGPGALAAAASVGPERFTADLIRPSAPDSPLRDPEAQAWLADLHALIRRVTSGEGAQEPPPAPEPAPAEPVAA